MWQQNGRAMTSTHSRLYNEFVLGWVVFVSSFWAQLDDTFIWIGLSRWPSFLDLI